MSQCEREIIIDAGQAIYKMRKNTELSYKSEVIMPLNQILLNSERAVL